LSNETMNETLDKRIPRSSAGVYSSCKVYKENTTEEETCGDYVYDDVDGTYSIVTEVGRLALLPTRSHRTVLSERA